MAILIVNGKHNYKDRLWVELSISNIIKFTSVYNDYKIFIWNHDYQNPKVNNYLNSIKQYVEILNEENFDLSQWAGVKCEKGALFAGGFHAHRTPLQILYEFIIMNYNVDIIFTFDNDSWPIRHNWDVPLVYQLENNIKLAGVWRDELKAIIPPYIHPCCLGIKVETINGLNLRFDYEPIPPRGDTLSHFTHTIRKHFGDTSILPLNRSNKKEYHSVFNGIYGLNNAMIYHHHLGSRYKDRNISSPKTYGWQERGESLENNKFILDSTTHMVFNNTENLIDELSYGTQTFKYNLYSNYLKNIQSEEAYLYLLNIAKEMKDINSSEAYFILGLIIKYFTFNKDFIKLYIHVCDKLGYAIEAKSYCHIAKRLKKRNPDQIKNIQRNYKTIHGS